MKKILLVEDNTDNRDIICEFLAAYNFDVYSVKDGQEGLEKFREIHPDLVVSDVLLPKINGRNLCQMIKQESENKVPVILISALYKSYSLRVEAKEKYGADDYMIKPLNLLELVEKISGLLKIAKPQLGTKARKLSGNNQHEAPGPPTKDEISETVLFELIHHLKKRKLTGTLKVSGSKYSHTLYLHDGYPIYVASNNPQETYQALLIRDKKLDEKTLNDMELKAKSLSTTLGKLLVEAGAITKKDLAYYLISEVSERLSALLKEKSGRYEFMEDKSFLEKIKRPPMEIENPVYQATFYIAANAIENFYSTVKDCIVEKVEDRLETAGKIEWKEEDLTSFALIDGETSIAQLLAKSSQKSTDMLRIIFTLEMLGIIQLK